jgi:hypothetical protein
MRQQQQTTTEKRSSGAHRGERRAAAAARQVWGVLAHAQPIHTSVKARAECMVNAQKRKETTTDGNVPCTIRQIDRPIVNAARLKALDVCAHQASAVEEEQMMLQPCWCGWMRAASARAAAASNWSRSRSALLHITAASETHKKVLPDHVNRGWPLPCYRALRCCGLVKILRCRDVQRINRHGHMLRQRIGNTLRHFPMTSRVIVMVAKSCIAGGTKSYVERRVYYDVGNNTRPWLWWHGVQPSGYRLRNRRATIFSLEHGRHVCDSLERKSSPFHAGHKRAVTYEKFYFRVVDLCSSCMAGRRQTARRSDRSAGSRRR